MTSHSTEEAFRRARERGNEARALELKKEGMLSLSEISELLKKTESEVISMAADMEIIALDDAEGNVAYPEWQVQFGRVMPGIQETLSLMEGSHWTAYAYLKMPCPNDGKEELFYQKLEAGEVDLVLRYFEGAQRGDFW